VSFRTSLSPRSAHSGRILIDSSRRNPNAASSCSDILEEGSVILARYVLVAHPLKRVGDLDEHARRRAAWQLCRRDCDGRVASPRSSGPASARRQAQSLSPFLAPFLLPFTLSCRCWCVKPVRSVFLSVPNARRVGIYKGLGTPLPIRAESVVACHGCTRSWHRWRFLWEVDSSRRAIDPGLGGAPLRRGVARIPRERA
jgi:hypothetical protein